MINDKIKVRLSNFVVIIIENDCQMYGFIKKDNSSNRNKFLNKLIPHLLELRKARREDIRYILSNDFQRKNAEEIYNIVNLVIDQVYFGDIEFGGLDDAIWIRPNKESMSAFDEIEDSETQITCLDLTTYIRSLLNEYAKLPHYKRQAILFQEELGIVNNAYFNSNILHFKYGKVSYKIYVFKYLYGFIADQHIYVIGYDINKKQIRAFLLYKMANIYTVNKKFVPDKKLKQKLNKFLESCDYSDNNIVEVE